MDQQPVFDELLGELDLLLLYKDRDALLQFASTHSLGVEGVTPTSPGEFVDVKERLSHLASLVLLVLDGQYLQAIDAACRSLGSDLSIQYLLEILQAGTAADEVDDTVCLKVKRHVYKCIDSSEQIDVKTKVFECMVMGVSFLQFYCQANFTGPELTNKQLERLSLPLSESEKDQDLKIEPIAASALERYVCLVNRNACMRVFLIAQWLTYSNLDLVIPISLKSTHIHIFIFQARMRRQLRIFHLRYPAVPPARPHPPRELVGPREGGLARGSVHRRKGGY